MDDNYSELDMDTISETLIALKAFTDAAETHGIMCGFICAGITPDNTQWLEPILGQECTPDILSTKKGQLLQTLFDISFNQLQGFEFNLLLLLPDDETDITLRSEALGLWCQGLLAGLALADASIRDNTSEELQTTLLDLTKITCIDSNNIDNNEESEEALCEVIEYVRMAVLLIHSLLNIPEHSAIVSPPSEHIH